MKVRGLYLLIASAALACTANVDSGAPSAEETAPAAQSKDAEVQAELARMEAARPAIDKALISAGHDPAAAESEAKAIASLPERAARLAAAKQWNDKYGSAAESVLGKLASAPEDHASLAPVTETAATLRGDVNANPYTACAAGGSDSAPWSRAYPNDMYEIRNSGLVSVFETGAVIDGETSESRISGGVTVSPAEGELTVRGTINVASGWVEVWSTPPFGYANAGIGMRITVRANGAVVCTKDLTIAEYSVWGKGEIAPGPRTVSCNFMKDANISFLSVDVALRAWNTAGGAAGAHAQANGYVTSMTSNVCVERGVLTNGQGACIEPFGNTVSGAGARPSECDGLVNQRWSFDSSRRIHSNHNVDLCLRPISSTPTSGTILVLATCDGTARQRYNRLSNGQLQLESNPALCVNAGAMSTFVSLVDCAPGTGIPQSQRFTFHQL